MMALSARFKNFFHRDAGSKAGKDML
jgi:hypothetical protein